MHFHNPGKYTLHHLRFTGFCSKAELISALLFSGFFILKEKDKDGKRNPSLKVTSAHSFDLCHKTVIL